MIRTMPTLSGRPEKPVAGPGLVARFGGRLHAGKPVDLLLAACGARAATVGRHVFVRSDLVRDPHSGTAAFTFAHEAVHLLQQRDARGEPVASPGPCEVAEREANREGWALLCGREPRVRYFDRRPVLRFLLDPGDFEPGVLPTQALDQVWMDPKYVDLNLSNFVLSQNPPWVLSVTYTDGASLDVPLERMFFEDLKGPTVTLFRRHTSSKRIVPFKAPQASLNVNDPSVQNLSAVDAMVRLVPPRFDTVLTPNLIDAVNAEQTRFLASGILKAIALRLMNPLLGGGPTVAAEGAAGRAAAGAAGRSVARNVLANPGTVTAEAAAAKNIIAPAGRLMSVLRAIQTRFVATPPSSLSQAFTIVADAVKSVGLEPGIVKSGTLLGDFLEIQNVGDVTTMILKSGEIIVKKGPIIVLRLIP